jgi:transcriptional regulator with XRE-family HTH domain
MGDALSCLRTEEDQTYGTSSMSIGVRLKELRVKKNKSLQELGDAVGASKAHIWEIERGGSKNPSMDLLTKLAEYFDVSVSYLVGEQPPSEEQEELIVLYRDLKELDEGDREAIRSLMKRFKEKKRED